MVYEFYWDESDEWVLIPIMNIDILNLGKMLKRDTKRKNIGHIGQDIGHIGQDIRQMEKCIIVQLDIDYKEHKNYNEQVCL